MVHVRDIPIELLILAPEDLKPKDGLQRPNSPGVGQKNITETERSFTELPFALLKIKG
jgi:hypothetical protein